MFRNIDKIKEIMHPDDWWTEYFVRPFSIIFVALIENTSITPNQITTASFIAVLTACVCIIIGGYPAYVIAAILLHISYIFDVADGILARYKKIVTPFGGWYDGISDRIKEFFIILALCLQIKPITLQTVLYGMYSLFLLAMYHGYITRNLPVIKETPAQKKEEQLNKLNTLRHAVKWGFFNLGEQFFLYSLFLALNKINLFFIVFMIYGTLSLISFSFLKYRTYYQNIGHEN